MRRPQVIGSVVGAVAVFLGVLYWAALAESKGGERGLIERGKKVYQRMCMGCHGPGGDGSGFEARLLSIKPPDLTRGIFKFRTTPTGELPTDEDLYHTITRGIFRSSMPHHTLTSEEDRRALVEYVKTFYKKWQTETSQNPIPAPDPPGDLGSPESEARGHELYELLQCWACHGGAGKANGPAALSLAPDTWNRPQVPFDFTRGGLKGGSGVKDVYRTFMTGLNGTAMDSYGDLFLNPDGKVIRENDAWHLVSYILTLRKSAVPSQTGK